jgi:hypothetical protein
MNYTPSYKFRLFPAICDPNVLAMTTVDVNANVMPTEYSSQFAGNGGTNAYHTLDKVSFLPSDIASTPISIFQNGWITPPQGSQFASPGFYKDPAGVLHLEGVLSSGTVGSIAFSLSSNNHNTDYRYSFLVYSILATGRIDIDIDGTVIVVQGINTQVSLDGICLPIGATWIAATLTNGWLQYGSPYAPAGYWKNTDGVVYLRGVVKSGPVTGSAAKSPGWTPRSAANAAIFTLPVGYRPDKGLVIPVISNNTVGRIDINTDGTVVAAVGNNISFSLDGISFPAFGSAVYVPPIYLNGWMTYNDYYSTAGYYRDNSGIVRVRGMIKSGTSGASAFATKNTYVDPSLPVGMDDFANDVNDTMAELNVVRQRRSIAPATFTPPAPAVGTVKVEKQHIFDLRAGTTGVVNYSAAVGSSGANPFWFSDPTLPDPTKILSRHLTEVRQVVDDTVNGARCSDCSSVCGVSCSANCISAGCTGGCSTVCATTCGGTCADACIATCSVVCTGNCANNCTGSCGVGCLGSCASACGGSCGSACAGGCSSACSSNSCQSSCSNGGCERSCSGYCNGYAPNTGCNGSCNTACSTGCGGQCYSACTVGCGGACNGGCTRCTNDCSNACKGTCAVGCTVVCSGICSGVCSTSTCISQCGSAGCGAACMQNCSSASCSTNCSGTCQAACYTTCVSSCSLGCSNTARLGGDASGRP